MLPCIEFEIRDNTAFYARVVTVIVSTTVLVVVSLHEVTVSVTVTNQDGVTGVKVTPPSLPLSMAAVVAAYWVVVGLSAADDLDVSCSSVVFSAVVVSAVTVTVLPGIVTVTLSVAVAWMVYVSTVSWACEEVELETVRSADLLGVACVEAVSAVPV
ncbi:hypothetical protein N7462_007324 [Penicillium macrosclerotiorum]|uniref:uncharacterized protein n=1 Tax=Penicillium macrosclerotiorum TaxID=303699 RepID=UPI002549A967|nr:uncharacterized protein N7462_007324 [Penicillium macrosclerotiorum]KAJ5679080.1 hypothetical protein N7462_007324 [Penicillium macrosclerotiorum]